jgi:hypothetical protein
MMEPFGQPGYGAPYGYPPPPYPGHPPAPSGPKNGLGTAALVTAVAGLLTALSVIGGVALGIVAVVLGLLGHGRVKRREADNGGIALAGIVLGALAVIAGIACTFIYLSIWRTVGGDDYLDCMTRSGSDTTLQQECMDRFRERFEGKFGTTPAPGLP